MPIFKHDDVDTFYLKEGEGEPLVLVTGFGTKYTSWNYQIPFFQEKMMVITLDNRGVGKSSRPDYPYSMDMFCNDIKALLEHLNVKEKVHFCGISMGGMIAQNFALKYPSLVKTLILCATTEYVEVKPLLDQIKLMKQLTPEQAFKIRQGLLFSRQFRKEIMANKELYDMMLADYLEDPAEVENYVSQAAAISDHDTREIVQNIEIPTLIMVGTKDILLPSMLSESLHEKIPNSRLEIFKGAGHGFIVEVADKVNQILWNFISEHLG